MVLRRTWPCVFGLLVHAARAKLLSLCQLLEDGTVEPQLVNTGNSTIDIGVWLPIRGILSGFDPTDRTTESQIHGRWYAVLVMEAAFQSWLDGSVLVPPVEKAPSDFRLVIFDSCPTPLNDDGRCSAAHVSPYALLLTQGNSLKGADIPAVRAVIGGGSHAALLAQTAGTRDIPVVGFESLLSYMSDRLRFPNYMRTNPSAALPLTAMAELIGRHLRYTRTNGLFCQVERGIEVGSMLTSLLAERGVQMFAFYLSPTELSGWPSGSQNDWYAFQEHIPEISARTFAQRQSVINEAKTLNAHVWLAYLVEDCAFLDVAHEIAMGGFEGPGYLWAGECPNFGQGFPFYYIGVPQWTMSHLGEYSPFFLGKVLDGYICADVKSLEVPPEHIRLALAIERLIATNHTLQAWYRDELEPFVLGYMFFDDNLYFLFDTLWAVILSINDLLLMHGGPTFDGNDLKHQLLQVDFAGVSGRVRFDESGNRRMDSFFIQLRFLSGWNDSFALSDHLMAGNPVPLVQLGTYNTEALDIQDPILFYDGVHSPPPDLDLRCTGGSFYDREGGTCRHCPPGEVTKVAGLHVCEQCLPGRVSRGWQQTACESCPTGHYATAFGATACTVCSAGSFAEAVQSTACSACPPGSVSSDVGSQQCTLCAEGTSNGRAGQTACASCERGSAAAVAGLSSCELCLPGRAATVAAASCLLCDLGRYADDNGWSTCANCSALKASFTATLMYSAEEGRWINIQGSMSEADCGCPRGSHNYTTSGECDTCSGEGVDCPGMGVVVVEPGYYSPADTVSIYKCYGHSARCSGGPPGMTCASGRFGLTCALCNAGTTPRADQSCGECTGLDYMPLVLLVGMIVPGVVAVYLFVSYSEVVKRSNMSLLVVLFISQLVNTLQHVSVLASLSVNWVDPVEALLDSVEFISVKIQTLRLECWGLQSALSAVLSQNLIILTLMLTFLTVHAVSSKYHGKHIEENQGLLIGSLSVFLVFLYIPMVEMMLGPLQCERHPNDEWTCRAFQSVTCWEGEEHLWLLTLSALISVLPIGFFAHCATVVWRFPEKVNNAEVEFLKSFSSLFFRYRPETHWYVLVHLLRSLAVGMVPVLPSAIVQVTTLQLVVICCALCSAYHMPWRVWQANIVDAVLSCYLVALCLWASFFLVVSQEDRTEIAWALTISIGVLIAVLSLVVVYASYVRYFRRTRTYKIVFCHRRGSVGALGRMLQLCAEQCLKSSFSHKQSTMLDCDLLVGFDMLLEIIANDSQKLVAIACEELWGSGLCIGELSIARLKAVPTVVLQLPKYQEPDPQVVLRATFDSGHDCSDLTSQGISPAMVEAAVRDFASLQRIHMLDTLSNVYVEKLTAVLVTTSSREVSSVELELDHVSGRPNVCIVASMCDVERAASAYLLHRHLARRLATLPSLMPYVLAKDAEAGLGVRLVVVIFGTSSMEDGGFLRALSSTRHHDVAALPVLVDTHFQFPSRDRTRECCVRVTGETEGKRLTDFILQVFKEIACLFQPRTASAELLEVQVSSIADRLKNRRFVESAGSAPQMLGAAACGAQVLTSEGHMVATASDHSHVSKV